MRVVSMRIGIVARVCWFAACAFLWHFRKTGDMAPKGNKRATSELGDVCPHDNGYRVQAQIDGKKERGPCRCTQAAAKQDLRKAQAADNHKQYADVLKQLREAAKSATSGGPYLAASEAPSGVTQPAASASQQQASAPFAAASAERNAANAIEQPRVAKKAVRSLCVSRAAAISSVSLATSGLCLVASGSETRSQQAQAVTSPTAPGLYPQAVESDGCSARDTSNADPLAPSPSKRLRKKSPAPVVPDLCHTGAGSSHDQATTAAIPAAPGLRLLAAGSDGSQPMNLAQQLTLRGLNIQYPFSESVPQPGQTDPCDGAQLAGKAGHTKCVTQAAVSDCLVVARVVKTPWCDDVAAGLKFFECVGNQKTRRINPFNSLKAGDLCVVVRSKDNKKVTAVAEVQGPQRLEQTDRSLLLQHLQPGRHDEIQNFLGDAPSFNVVFFSKVYDCSHLNLTLPSLVRQIPGLQEPGQLAGAPALNTSEDSQQRRKELRDAVEHFLTVSECPLRCSPALLSELFLCQRDRTSRDLCPSTQPFHKDEQEAAVAETS